MARTQTLPEAAPPPIARYPEGLGVPGNALRFDPAKRADLAFLSSAAVSVRAARHHRRVLATAQTLALLGIEPGAGALPAPVGRAFDLGGLSLVLRNSGRLLGAALAEVILNDGRVLAFVGPWRGSPGGIVPAGEVPGCDVLVMHAGYGVPGLELPPRPEALELAARFVRQARKRDAAPVLLADPLGAAQEVAARLAVDGVTVRLHPSAWKVAGGYADLGVDLGPCKRFTGTVKPGEALVLPPERLAAAARLGGPVRVAHLTAGEAAQGALRIPYADAGDHAELSTLAAESGAERVLVYGANAEALTTSLVAQGLDAESLAPADQLDLFATQE